MKSKNKLCFVSIDIEHDYADKEKFFRGVENLDKILDIFRKHGIPATLFITGDVLEKYKETVIKWSKDFEIACHSYSHRFWNTLDHKERQGELDKFKILYSSIFKAEPIGFRSPSHLIDEDALHILEEERFSYDSSVVPNYPFFKKYRGYKGRAPAVPYYPHRTDIRRKGEMNILEIPVAGQLFGLPLAGIWIARIPFLVFRSLFSFYNPPFITVNMHSWDILDNSFRKSSVDQFFSSLDRILSLLETKDYTFVNGRQIYEIFSKDKR
ncbi:MAG: polysaccharide deacetylase family protein [Candidatus Parcubacteria bacterium]|nr:polysaccharide deacetylase family protein [Candidatus Parcubacteria bacterium]